MSDDADGSGITADIWDDRLRQARSLDRPMRAFGLQQCSAFCYDACQTAWASCGNVLLEHFPTLQADVNLAALEHTVTCVRSIAHCSHARGEGTTLDSLVETLCSMTPLLQKVSAEELVGSLAKSRQLQLIVGELLFVAMSGGESEW